MKNYLVCQECHGNGFVGEHNEMCQNCYGVGKFFLNHIPGPDERRLVSSAYMAVLIFGILILAIMLSTGQLKMRWFFVILVTYIWVYFSYAGSLFIYAGLKIGHFFVNFVKPQSK